MTHPNQSSKPVPHNYKGSIPSAARDIEVTNLAVEKGLDQGIIGKQFGISSTRVGQILAKTTHRTQVMKFLLDRRDQKFTSREIAQTLRVDINKVQFVVAALAKRGKADFKRKTGTESGDHLMMYDISLNAAGLREAEALTKTTVVSYDPSKPHPEIQAAARAMAARPSQAALMEQAAADAKLDEIEKKEGAHTAKPDAAAIAAVPTITPYVNGGGVSQAPPVTPAAESPAPEPAPVPDAEDRQTEAALVAFGHAKLVETPTLSDAAAERLTAKQLEIVDIPRFPIISQLTTRNEKIQQAAKLIESAGPYDDLAITVLQRLDDFTALEREVLAYVERYGHPRDVQKE